MDVKRILGIVILAAGALALGILVGMTWLYQTGDESWIPSWWRGVNFSGVVEKYDGKILVVRDDTTKKTMEFDIEKDTVFVGGSDYLKEKDARIIVKYKPTKGRNIAKKIQQAEAQQGTTTSGLAPAGSPETGSPVPAGSPLETGTPAPSHT